MSDLREFVRRQASGTFTGSAQVTAVISADEKQRLAACAAMLRCSESALMRAMVEAGLTEIEEFVEKEGIQMPKGKKR